MEWTMLYLFVALKVPIFLAGALIWWAVRQEPALAGADEDGSGGTRARPHPRRPLPRPPRRGPHGGATAPAPPRSRPPAVRGRERTAR